MPDRPKLQDVADLAGVSIGTASNALNNKTVVLAETRERVLQAAAQLGYQLPARTNSLQKKELTTIGILIKRHSDQDNPIDPYYSAVLNGVEQACQRHHLSLMYASVEVDIESHARKWPPLWYDQKVDGWLILGIYLDKIPFPPSEEDPPPVVLVDSHAVQPLYDIISIENFHGAYTAVTYLIERGHRHIGLIGSWTNGYPGINLRRKGYLKALVDHGISQTYIEDGRLNSLFGYESSRRLLERCPEVTAIFACNDDSAIGVMRTAHELGRKIPDDLSLVGFDNLSQAADVIPPLSTMNVDKLLMGELAVQQLINRYRHPDRAPVTILVRTELIIRQSVCPVR
jgi:DNA-binding LacI/PurR family transcriptional regulator